MQHKETGRVTNYSANSLQLCQVLVTHACNPSYSGGRDQEDCDLKPAPAKSLRDPILKIPNTKRAGGVAQGVGPEFKPWYCPPNPQKRQLGPGQRKQLELC
jgi:hypothetical protein